MASPKKLHNYRQGEVLMFGLSVSAKGATEKIHKAGFTPKADNVIIEGEISGHKHEVENGKLYEKDGKIIIEAFKGCLLKHPEHKPTALPAGVYQIHIQEEYDEVKHKEKVKD